MKELEKEFVPYPESFELKELGFDEPCFGVFYSPEHEVKITNSDFFNEKAFSEKGILKAPTYSQAFRFFRENYGLDYEIPYAGKPKEYHAFVKDYVYGNNRNNPSVFSYEEAELACLKKLIEIVKTK